MCKGEEYFVDVYNRSNSNKCSPCHSTFPVMNNLAERCKVRFVITKEETWRCIGATHTRNTFSIKIKRSTKGF